MWASAAAAAILLLAWTAAPATGLPARQGQQAGSGAAAPGGDAGARASRVASLLQLAVEEYATAMDDGEIVNQMEYDETEAFTRQARDLYASLLESGSAPSGADSLLPRFETLLAHVDSLRPEEGYRDQVERLVRGLGETWGAQPVQMPDRRPSASRGAALYRQECMSCHGADGSGAAQAVEYYSPPPADLGGEFRHAGAPPMRDYQVITYGVPRTVMAGYGEQLSVEERWDLVAYVQSMRFAGSEVAEGKSIALGDGEEGGASPIAGRIRNWSTPDGSARLNDGELARRVRQAWAGGSGDSLTAAEAQSVVAFVRSLYGTPEAGVPEADRTVLVEARIARVDSLARQAVALSRKGSGQAARTAAINSYMAFESLEPTLQARAPGLVTSSERAFSDLRAAAGTERIGKVHGRLQERLTQVEETLTADPSWWAVAGQSLFIILREGFEAILIIGAIIAFLVKTDNEERRREVYGGVWGALGASLLTAVAFETIFQIGPASQELLEGATMLLATVVLFSVSYWLLSKLEHRKWERYLRDRMSRAVGSGSGLALAGVAFLAVYREGFETVLFYKALFISSGGEISSITGGFLAGCVGLVFLYLAFTRWGVKIPMRPFFAATSGVLYLMAVVFAGQGINELQAAGTLGTTPVAWAPRVDVLGVYPTVESLLVQGALVAALLVGLAITFGRSSAGSTAAGQATGERDDEASGDVAGEPAGETA